MRTQQLKKTYRALTKLKTFKQKSIEQKKSKRFETNKTFLSPAENTNTKTIFVHQSTHKHAHTKSSFIHQTTEYKAITPIYYIPKPIPQKKNLTNRIGKITTNMKSKLRKERIYKMPKSSKMSVAEVQTEVKKVAEFSGSGEKEIYGKTVNTRLQHTCYRKCIKNCKAFKQLQALLLKKNFLYFHS